MQTSTVCRKSRKNLQTRSIARIRSIKCQAAIPEIRMPVNMGKTVRNDWEKELSKFVSYYYHYIWNARKLFLNNDRTIDEQRLS